MTPQTASETFTSLRGLMAPVENGEPDAACEQAQEVELGRVRPNPRQPRRENSAAFSDASIEELAENIRQHGILQPLLVKDTGRFYQIIAGERRYRAAQRAGLETVPVRVIEPRDEQEELRIALAENLQRKNLGPLEEAYAYRTLIDRYGLSYRDLGKLVGRSASHVHGRLQLLDHDDVREALERKKVGIADGIQLARVPDEARRRELLAAVEDGSLRGAALHRQVQVFLGELSPESAAALDTPQPAPPRGDLLEAALEAVEHLGEELSDEERRALYTLAARAAERLDLRLTAPPRRQAKEAAPRAAAPPPRAPQPLTVDVRHAIQRTKEHRNSRGYTLANLIQVYWMTMQRRGYTFAPGDWGAAPGGDGRYLVSFTYKVDGEPRRMEWWHSASDGAVEPANEDARQLSE